MSLDPTWIALIGTVFGGAGLKALEYGLGRGRVKVDEATSMRAEMRTDLTAQKAEIANLEGLVDKWREDYYTLFEKYVSLQTNYTLALTQIQKDAEDGKNSIADLPPATPPPTINNETGEVQHELGQA